jgi:DNA-nicking Smr family endonuclease
MKNRNKEAPRPVLNSDDEKLFLSAMKGAQHESETAKKHPYTEGPVSKTHQSRRPDIAREPMRAKETMAALAPGRSADLDRRTLQRLRRGHLRPEARLDLHGMTQDQAYCSLMSFLEDSQAGGKRCVLVITGRGRTSDGGGILRKETPGWLNSPISRSRVLAFATAMPRDGGVGALYVLLRRGR